MKKIIFCLPLLVCSCSSKPAETKIANSPQVTDNSIGKLPETLQILGTEIWALDAPSRGKAVVKLVSKKEYRVLERGRVENRSGKTDYWYRVQANGDQGWVFGAETSATYFTAAINPLFERLSFCKSVDSLVYGKRAPEAKGYWFKPDMTFAYSTHDVYDITGIYEWKDGIVTLYPKKLNVTTQSVVRSGSISFYVNTRLPLVCFELKEDNLTDNTYGPSGGCFCLN